MAGADLTIRASVADGARAKTELEAIGTAGTQALTRVRDASTSATLQLQNFAAATSRVAQSSAGFDAARLGIERTGTAATDATVTLRGFASQVVAGGGSLAAFGQAAQSALTSLGPGGALAAGALSAALMAANLLGASRAAESFEDAIKRQRDALRTAEGDARQYRDGLVSEATTVRQLTEYYQQLDSARQSQEMRALARDQASNEAAQGTLRRDALGVGSGLSRQFQQQTYDAEQMAARNYGRGSAEFQAIISDPDLQRMRDFVAVVEGFRETGDVSRDALARLAEAMSALATGSDVVSRRIRDQAQNIDGLTGRARDAEEAQAALAARAAAMGVNIDAAAVSAQRLDRALANLAKYEGGIEDGIGREIASLERQIAAATRGAQALATERANIATEDRITRSVAAFTEQLERNGITGEVATQRLAEFREGLNISLPRVQALTSELRGMEDGFRRSARAADDMRDVYDVLRRNASTGLLSLSPSDDRAMQEISAQTRDLRQQREREAREQERQAERAQTQADQFASRWGDRLADATSQGLFDGFTKGQSIFTTLTRTFTNLLRQAVSSALSNQVFTPLVASIAGGGGSSLGNLFGLGSLFGGSATGSSINRPFTSGETNIALTALGDQYGPAVTPAVQQGINAANSGSGGFSFSNILGLGNLANTASGGSLFGNLGLGGLNTGISSVLATPLWTSSTSTALTSTGFYANTALAGEAGSFAGGGGVALGPTLGSALGGIGGGFGAGMLLNSLAGGTKTGGMVGSGAGALAGAAIGSIIPGIGTLIGGLIGGAAGGLFGGLFGPKKSFSGGEVIYGVNPDGQFDVLGSPSKNFDMSGPVAEVRAQLDKVNKALALAGIRISTEEVTPGDKWRNTGAPTGVVAAGQGQTTGDISTSLATNIRRMGTSDDPNVVTVLRRGRSDNETSLQSVLDDVAFVKDTYNVLLKNFREPMSDFARQVAAVVGPFDDAIKNAEKLGLATDELTQARERERGLVVEQRNRTLIGFNDTAEIRRRRAAGADPEGTDLFALDIQARNEIQALRDQLRSLGTTADETAQFVADLESAQRAEREAVQRRYAEQAAAQKAAIERLARPLSDFARQVAQVVAPFDAAITAAQQLGLATAELVAVREIELGKVVEQRNRTLTGLVETFDSRRRRASGTDPEGADLADFDIQARDELRSLRGQMAALGATAAETADFVGELEAAQGDERLAIQRRYNDQAIEQEKQRVDALLAQGQNIRDWIDRQRGTGVSGAAPLDRLTAARDTFARDLALARGSDAGALSRITGQADALLSAGRDVYASGSEFQTIRDDLLAQLGGLPATLAQDTATATKLGNPTDGMLAAFQAALPGLASDSSIASAEAAIRDGFSTMVAAQERSTGRLEYLAQLETEGAARYAGALADGFTRQEQTMREGFGGMIALQDRLLRDLDAWGNRWMGKLDAIITQLYNGVTTANYTASEIAGIRADGRMRSLASQVAGPAQQFDLTFGN